MDENIKVDIEKLLAYSLPFAETLLKEYQEFFPFAAYLNTDKEIRPLGIHEGDDHPKSQTLLDNLEEILKRKQQTGELTAFAITCDVRIKSVKYPEGVDAIVIKAFHKTNDFHSNFYYPYELKSSKFTLGEGWRDS